MATSTTTDVEPTGTTTQCAAAASLRESAVKTKVAESPKLTYAQRIALTGRRGIYVTIQLGFDRVAVQELLEALPNVVPEDVIHERGIAFVPLDDYESITPEVIGHFRSIEYAFALICAKNIEGLSEMSKEEALEAIREVAAQSSAEVWNAAKDAAWRARGVKEENVVAGPQFQVFRKRYGKHQFASTDIGMPIYQGLTEILPEWEGVLKDPNVSIMGRVSDNILLLGVKLMDELSWWNKLLPYERQKVLTPLRPATAHSLAKLSAPQPGDIFVDPMSGCGTIPEVAVRCFPDLFCISGEMDELSVQKARHNADASPLHGYLDVVQWDARRLPLRNDVIQRMACDLPFGKKCGTRAKNPKLYNDLMHEIDRILTRDGNAVLLSGDMKNLERNNPPSNTSEVEQWRVQCGGLDATVKILHKLQTPFIDSEDSPLAETTIGTQAP